MFFRRTVNVRGPWLCAGLIAAVSACTGSQSSPETYARLQDRLHRDQQFRAGLVGKCTTDFTALPAKDKKDLADLVKTAESRAPNVACERLFGGVESGKIIYEDFEKIRTGINLTSTEPKDAEARGRIQRVLRGG